MGALVLLRILQIVKILLLFKRNILNQFPEYFIKAFEVISEAKHEELDQNIKMGLKKW